MTLQTVEIPESIKRITLGDRVESLIDRSNERLEAFHLADQTVIENFVNCDFHLLAQSLVWIEQNHLLAGNRFCEWGSGFGVATMLAAVAGMEAIGIEIEPTLVSEASELADSLDVDADFYCGSFVPNVDAALEFDREIQHVETQAGSVYEEVGLEINDFDLFFAFPWPGEHVFFESIFDQHAAVNALLLTYRGRDGMNLVRKV